jgi:hypothetical protein
VSAALVYVSLHLFVFGPSAPIPSTTLPTTLPLPVTTPPTLPTTSTPPKDENNDTIEVLIATVVSTSVIVVVTILVTRGTEYSVVKLSKLIEKKVFSRDDKAYKTKKGMLGSTVEVESALKYLSEQIDKAQRMRNKKGSEMLKKLSLRAELEMALVNDNLQRDKDTFLQKYEKIIEDLNRDRAEREEAKRKKTNNKINPGVKEK